MPPEELQEGNRDAAIEDSLLNKSPLERHTILRKTFRRKVQSIECATSPDLCQRYPELEKEIIEAYLGCTTFTGKVWVNYDVYAKKFYETPHHAMSAGKLVLRPKAEARAKMQELARQGVEVKRVQLEVGTVFRKLCYIELRANAVYGEIKALCKPETGDHPELMCFLRHVCNSLSDCPLPREQSGFRMEDVNAIAGMLRRRRVDDDAFYEDGRFFSPWYEDFVRPEQIPGSNGFHALNQRCDEPDCDVCPWVR